MNGGTTGMSQKAALVRFSNGMVTAALLFDVGHTIAGMGVV